jgi:hypothetical protein
MEKTHEDMIEISGSIIDIFEDFLESRGITLQGTEKERLEYADLQDKKKEDYTKEDIDSLRECAIIFGSDYDELENSIEEILKEILK